MDGLIKYFGEGPWWMNAVATVVFGVMAYWMWLFAPQITSELSSEGGIVVVLMAWPMRALFTLMSILCGICAGGFSAGMFPEGKFKSNATLVFRIIAELVGSLVVVVLQVGFLLIGIAAIIGIQVSVSEAVGVSVVDSGIAVFVISLVTMLLVAYGKPVMRVIVKSPFVGLEKGFDYYYGLLFSGLERVFSEARMQRLKEGKEKEMQVFEEIDNLVDSFLDWVDFRGVIFGVFTVIYIGSVVERLSESTVVDYWFWMEFREVAVESFVAFIAVDRFRDSLSWVDGSEGEEGGSGEPREMRKGPPL